MILSRQAGASRRGPRLASCVALAALVVCVRARADVSPSTPPPPAAGASSAPAVPDLVALAAADKLRAGAMLLAAKRQQAAALAQWQRALEQARAAVGPADARLLPFYRDLRSGHLMTGDHVRSLEVAEAALAVAEKAYGAADVRLVKHLDDVATAQRILGDNAASQGVYKRALALIDAQPNPDAHPKFEMVLSGLGVQYALRNRWREAMPLFQRYVTRAEKKWGRGSSLHLHALDLLGSMLEMRHDLGGAERIFKRTLAEREKLSGADSTDLVASLTRLAWLDLRRGNHTRAEATFKRILDLYAKAAQKLAAKSPAAARGMADVEAAFLEQLGHLYDVQGQAAKSKAAYDRAEVLRLASWKAHEVQFQGKPELLAPYLGILASHYRQRRELVRAEPLLRRALALSEQGFGADSLMVMTNLLLLGNCLEAKQDLVEAEKLYRRSMALHEKKLGTRTSAGLTFLADLTERQGRFKEAQQLFERVHASALAGFGPSHVSYGQSLHRLGLLRAAQDDVPGAVERMAKAEEAFEQNLRLVLATAGEKDKRAFLERIGAAHHLDDAVSLHLGPGRAHAAAGLHALTVLLRRKGRSLDALADAVGAARKRATPEIKSKLDRLQRQRGLLSRLVMRGRAEHEEAAAFLGRVAALEDAVRALESELVALSPTLRAATLAVTVDGVRARIPKDARLVELTLFEPRDPKRGDHARSYFAQDRPKAPKPHYAAYIVGPEGLVAAVDLGPADAIERRVQRLRAAFASPTVSGADARARALAKKLLLPIEPHIANVKHLLLSPDGALNLVPFGALPTPDGKYLLERHRITYLTSGRDLLRVSLGQAPASGAVVVAAPTFGSALVADGEAKPAAEDALEPLLDFSRGARGLRSFSLESMQWAPLPGTAEEAVALRGLITDARVLVGDEATESALKAVRAPRLLHVATHGFFLPRQELPPGVPETSPENPLLRSGLVLAGANRRESGDEDGVLTALEATSLDLLGTELVVLSACETGLGDVLAGDGVYGLRRALVIAGAESQVMTLWRVDDAASRTLMEGFYKRLGAGEGRSDALRGAQLEMLQTPARAHPFYWAAFIQTGAWSAMSAPVEPAAKAP